MNNEEINKAMAKIAGKCWHEWNQKHDVSGLATSTSGAYRGTLLTCNKCPAQEEVYIDGYARYALTGKYTKNIPMELILRKIPRPDYTNDLNLVRKVELQLVTEGLGEKYKINL